MNKKQKLIVILGPMAVGKLTIAKKLSKKIDFKLSHNHLIIDLVESIYTREDKEFYQISEEMRNFFYKKVIESRKNFIITHAYSANYISPTGKSDNDLLNEFKKMSEDNNREIYFVHLKASEKVILERLTKEDRRKFGKLTDASVMKELFEIHDFSTSPVLDNLLVIDNSNLTASECVDKIYNFLNFNEH